MLRLESRQFLNEIGAMCAEEMLMSEAQMEDSLKVAIRDGAAVVEVYGRGSFKMGPALKQFGVSAITRYRCTRMVMNMADCETMDSTFMGVIAGLAMRIKRDQGGEVVLLNLSDRTLHLLSTLGLDRVVRVFKIGGGPAEGLRLFEKRDDLSDVDVTTVARSQNVETMLDAHKDLVTAVPENLTRFQDVIEYLNRDAAELRNGGAVD